MDDRTVWVEQMRHLLDLERQAEAEETRALRERKSPQDLAASGLVLLKLSVDSESVGAGGRPHLILSHPRAEPLADHRFRPGDLAEITERDGRRAATCVITKVRPDRVEVLLDDDPEDSLAARIDLWRLSSDVTWRRMERALATLIDPSEVPGKSVVRHVFGDSLKPVPEQGERFEPLDIHLDESQRDAVARALLADAFFLVHGPPGTGKTTALVEFVRQSVRQGQRLLVCATTNVAVDHLGERLAAAGERVLRLGHPARIAPRLTQHTLDALLAAPERSRVFEALRREIERDRRKAKKARQRDTRRALQQSTRGLERELRDLERQATRDILSSAPIILCTTTGAGDNLLLPEFFDVAVLDEATQALEAAAWIPLLKARKAVLAGDHHQLPPTILSPEAERGGLGQTLFDRMVQRDGPRNSSMLTRQYRMHRTIMAFSGEHFYEGRLEADPSVEAHRLDDLSEVTPCPGTEPVLLFIDTSGRDFHEETDDEQTARWNDGEAQLLELHARELIAAGLDPREIAAISPYHAQVRRLRQRLQGDFPNFEIDTVDGFQGREKEAVLISLVRSNPDGEVGFLSDPRRLNVAITRGRRQVVVIGDASTVARDPFLEKFLRHLEAHGTYRSAWEYDLP